MKRAPVDLDKWRKRAGAVAPTDLKDQGIKGIRKKRVGCDHVERRVTKLREELAKTPLTPGVLVQKYAKEWNIGERQVHVYLQRIRKELQEEAVVAAPSRREEMILSVKEYYAAARAAKAWGPAGRALQTLIGLEGLAAPQRVELTGRDGAPVQVQRESVDGLNEAELAVLVRATEKLLGEAPKDEPEVH